MINIVFFGSSLFNCEYNDYIHHGFLKTKFSIYIYIFLTFLLFGLNQEFYSLLNCLTAILFRWR